MRIQDSVVVVTGASSGIGRATAEALQRGGACTVLVARRGAELDRLVAAAPRGRALAVPADVSDAAAVQDVAALTVERFGRIDGWVNCAGVTMFGGVLDTPPADVARVLDVNVMGYLHGARAALPHMIAEGSGVLVNVSSLLGVIAPPYVSAYAMSKFAIRALGVSLRQELRLAGVGGVHVTTVLPAAIDTPIYRDAAKHGAPQPAPPPPVYATERAARTVVAALRRPRREIVAGGVLARASMLSHALAPGLTERVLADDMARSLRTGPDHETTGSLYAPPPGPPATHGDAHGRRSELVRRVAGAGALVAVAAALRRHRSRV